MKRPQKTFFILSIIILCLLFSGDISIHASEDGSYRYGYLQLTENCRGLYDRISSAVESFCSSEKYLSEDLSEAELTIVVNADDVDFTQINHVFSAFYYDNPQYFWLSSTSRASSASAKTLTFYIDSDYASASSRMSAADAITETCDIWLPELKAILNTAPQPGAPADSNIYLTALHLHDLIIGQIDYTYKNGKPSTDKSAHNIAGVLDGSGAVCEGYARTFQYLLNLLDIDNIYLTGQSRGQGHAWNCIKLDGEYYCVDATWDDGNNNSYLSGYDNRLYDYFCTPISVFKEDHTPESTAYTIPAFSDSRKYVYYSYFGSLSEKELTAEGAESLINDATAKCHGDYIYYIVPSVSSIRTLRHALGLSGSFYYINSAYGFLYIHENIKINFPADSILLSPEADKISLNTGDTVKLSAALRSTEGECDDRVIWRISNSDIASVSIKGGECTVLGKRDGIVTLTATAAAGKNENGENLSASVTITVGTGVYAPLYTLWANGDKTHKSIVLTPSVSPGSYRDSKGKLKSGKLVWMVLNEKSDIAFDTETHRVLTKGEKGPASVSGSGKVTAKQPGTVYVYCIDTGSMTWDCFDIEILQAPTKLCLSSVAGSTEKSNLVKNAVLPVGSTGNAYIIPTAKNSACSEMNTYTVSYAKTADSKYLKFTQPISDPEGNISFSATGLSYDTAKKKPASVKLIITNDQSGKKTTLNVKVTNPVSGFSPAFSKTVFSKKKDTITIKLNPLTCAGTGTTTDKLKIYAAGDITLNGNKVVKTGKTSIRLKYNKNTNELVLTLNSDYAEPTVIAAVSEDSATRTALLWYIACIDESGTLCLMD